MRHIYIGLLQGSILDRIDYNIENAHIKVEAGLGELKKARKHQSSNMKMKCILIEAVIVISLIFILLLTKT